MSKSGIRIEGAQMAHNSRVFYVAEDGTETEISDHVTCADIHMNVGDVTTARLELVLVEGKYDPAVVELVTRHYGRKWRWLVKLQRRWRDVTTFRAVARSYIR